LSDISVTFHQDHPHLRAQHHRDDTLSADLEQWSKSNILPALKRDTDDDETHRKSSISDLRLDAITEKENTLNSLSRVRMYGEMLVWAEYFNSMLKCWEPLLEPLSVGGLYEQVR
jgi:hypothetical protein